MLEKIIYPKLSYEITGLCFKVHNQLGRFAKERQYADALEILLQKTKIKYQREIAKNYKFEQANIGRNIIDFLIEEKIIVELKAKQFITKTDYRQVQRYLQATNSRLGLLVNFNNRYLKPKRIINYLYHSY